MRHNQQSNRYKWEEFTDKVNEKFRKTSKPTYTIPGTAGSMEAKFRESFTKKRMQLREDDKARQNKLMQKMFDKMRQKEAVQKKKDEIMHFSLLKQKEILHTSMM